MISMVCDIKIRCFGVFCLQFDKYVFYKYYVKLWSIWFCCCYYWLICIFIRKSFIVKYAVNSHKFVVKNERGSCEVDFVVDTGELIIPVEVKAEVNLRAKSLKMYREKFSPEVSVRTSMSDYKKEDWLLNLPLYAIDQIEYAADYL